MTEIQLKKLEISYTVAGKKRSGWCLVPVDSTGLNPMREIIVDLELIENMDVNKTETLIYPEEFKCNVCGTTESSYDDLDGRAHKCESPGTRLHDFSFGTFEKVGHLGYISTDGEDFENQEVDRMADSDENADFDMVKNATCHIKGCDNKASTLIPIGPKMQAVVCEEHALIHQQLNSQKTNDACFPHCAREDLKVIPDENMREGDNHYGLLVCKKCGSVTKYFGDEESHDEERDMILSSEQTDQQWEEDVVQSEIDKAYLK
jgi:hypothetical protein